MSTILTKYQGNIHVEIFDKAQHHPQDRMVKSPLVKSDTSLQRTIKYVSEKFDQVTRISSVQRRERRLIKGDSRTKEGLNYIYEVEGNTDKIKALAEILRRGIEVSEELISIKYLPLKLLSDISKSEYYGNKIGDSQYKQGNCAVKEVTGALKSVLFEKGKSPRFAVPGQTMNAALNNVIKEIVCHQLESVGYGKDISTYLRDQYKIYYDLKEDLKPVGSNDKARDTKLLKKLFSDSLVPYVRFKNAERLDKYFSKNPLPDFKKIVNPELKIPIAYLTNEEKELIRLNICHWGEQAQIDPKNTKQCFRRLKEQSLNRSKEINSVPSNSRNISMKMDR